MIARAPASPRGVDVTLIRWMLSLSSEERLAVLQGFVDSVADVVGNDLSPRVDELARKSSDGLLAPEERQEYAEIARLNDLLSRVKLQAGLA